MAGRRQQGRRGIRRLPFAVAQENGRGAICIFELNVELHPDSANTHDSLGEAYMAAGDKAQAVKNYSMHCRSRPTARLCSSTMAWGASTKPAGEPAGQTRTYSAVSAYSIDQASMTATEVWDYDAGQTIYSPVCSSAYEAADQSILVDYATASNGTEALLVGLAFASHVVFEFKYPTSGCNTSWNARPIPLDDLKVNE